MQKLDDKTEDEFHDKVMRSLQLHGRESKQQRFTIMHQCRYFIEYKVDDIIVHIIRKIARQNKSKDKYAKKDILPKDEETDMLTTVKGVKTITKKM